MSRVLITGASGFIGKALCASLKKNNFTVRRVVRRSGSCHKRNFQSKDIFSVDNIGPHTNWANFLIGVDVVIHLAARVHVMHDKEKDPLNLFQETNTAGTENLARVSSKSGVRRFIYLSSIKVNGEETEWRTENSVPSGGKNKIRFSETDVPNPQDPYAVSKWKAEQILHSIAKENSMEVVIIRPPLVYGPGVKANFLNLMCWLYRGVPLPLGAIHNQRSLVALDNLIDLIISCISNPAAGNQTFLAGDGEDLSTSELLRRLSIALGKPIRLLPVPVWLLKSVLNAIGKRDIAKRLCGSLQVDISKSHKVLGWTPPLSVDEALKLTADWYKGIADCRHIRN